jgi:glycosyltransferase involved in cell wall biosynthesis
MMESTLPKISLVTPSFNQGRYLAHCMESILNQKYPALEYFVLDGGSTDGSVEVIRRYADRLTDWRSHPDGGQLNALQEGFSRSTGEIMGWLNSDDMIMPWTLRLVADIFLELPQVDWITTRFPLIMDSRGIVVKCWKIGGFHARAFYRGMNAPLDRNFHSTFIQQESTFWRRSLWEKAGARIDCSIRVVGDFELWSRVFKHTEILVGNAPIGCVRRHAESGSVTLMDACMVVFRQVLNRFGYQPPPKIEGLLRKNLRNFPQRLTRLTGLAYPTKAIYRDREQSRWILLKESFL